MVEKMLIKSQIRFVADALAGLAVFTGLSTAMLGSSAAAGLVGKPAEAAASVVAGWPLAASQASTAMVNAGDVRSNLMVLAVVFSTLFALNLAFVRHLAKSHATVAVRSRHHTDEAEHDGTHGDATTN